MVRLAVVSGFELVKALERLGFEQVRQRGSHVILRREGVGTVVPLHAELKRGTLTGILRQAQVDIDEIVAALGKK